MRFSTAVLIAVLAAPAFCQEPSPDKINSLADQAAQMELQAGKMAAAAQALSSDKADKAAALAQQVAQFDMQFDFSGLSGLADKAAAMADKVDTLDLDSQLSKLKMLTDSTDFSPAIASAQADQDAALEQQMSKFDTQFDFSGLSELAGKAAAIADQVGTLDLDSQLSRLKDLDSKPFTLKDLVAKPSRLKMLTDSEDFSAAIAAAQDSANQVNMAFFQSPQAKPFPADAPAPPMAPMAPIAPKGRISMGRADGEYDAGTRALDQHKYDEAVQRYDAVINSKAPRADGALYWKAYALNRLGKRDDALAVIADLRRDYATSGWLKDAQALETEVKQSNGQPISPAQESNDDLKLLAINALMNADSEKAIPLIEGLLKGNGAPNVKSNALFVLAHSRAPRAQQVLADYAKGSGNPDLQLRAIQYVGESRTRESQQLLISIYGATGDARVKNLILQQLMESRASDALMNIAKSEKDVNLRDFAIRELASDKSAPLEGLLEIYASSDANAKHAIVDGLQSRRDAKTLVDLARKEADPATKKMIVERLSSMRENKDAMDYMIELLK